MLIKDDVVSSRPHVCVINETRSCSSVASHVSVPSYDMHETPAVRSSPTPPSGGWLLLSGTTSTLTHEFD